MGAEQPTLLVPLFPTTDKSRVEQFMRQAADHLSISVTSQCLLVSGGASTALPDPDALAAPKWVQQLIRTELQSGRLIPGQSVVVMDGRNPLLTPHDLLEALKQARQTGLPTLSIAPVRDHPCQYRMYSDLVASCLLAPPDPGYSIDALQPRPHLVSHAFPFLWNEVWVNVACTSRCYHIDEKLGRVVPLEHLPKHFNPEQLLYYAGSDMARCVLPGTPHSGTSLPGAFFTPLTTPFSASLLKNGHVGVHVNATLPVKNGDTMVVFCFAGQQSTEHRLQFKDTPATPAPSTPALVVPPDTRFMACLLLRSGGPCEDLEEHLSHECLPWSVNPVDGQPQRKDTGALITGRQDFPTIYRLDGSLAAGTADQLAELVEHVRMERFTPHNLEARSLIIHNEIDALRAEVKSRAELAKESSQR